MATDLRLPSGIDSRIRRDLTRRGLLVLTGVALLIVAALGIACLAGLGLDRYLLLPSVLRRQAGLVLLLPAIGGLVALLVWLVRSRATERDLRRLDNQTDDMRAAMNLVERVQRGEQHLNRTLIDETVRRASQFVAEPLPPLPAHRRRLRRVAIVCGLVLLGLIGYRLLAADLHTGISRYLHPDQDYGSVGPQKFHLQAEVWQNQAAAFAADEPAAEPRKKSDVYFLRERREGGAWVANFDTIATSAADWLAGYNPLAVRNREVAALAGDRLVLKFNAVDQAGNTGLSGVNFVRFEGDRQIPLRYLKVEDVGTIVVDRLRGDYDFQLRAGDQFSPRYQVRVTERPTPTKIYLFQRQPAQYGKATREITIRDRDASINQNRISGLPGSRLAIEFATPYGADLDPHASYAVVGDGKRMKLRYVTSRNAERRARGEKLWTFDFTLDETIAAGAKLQLHLVTKKAKFADQPIDNQYDEPLLVHVLEDLPPSVEFTMLPEKRHFAADEVFACRYHYSDDYGVAEVGLEIQNNPNMAEVTYIPIGVREADAAGQMRREDELLYILDLKPLYYNFASFSIVVKDVKGQVAKTGLVTLTTSDNFTETLLPKLTGGWKFWWSYSPTNIMVRPGDLETSPAAVQLAAYRKSLDQVRNVLDGKLLDGQPRDPAKPLDLKPLVETAKGLAYQHTPYLINGQQPFAYHHRDYPNYFQRQSTAYLNALATLGGAGVMTETKRLVEALAASPDPLAAPEFELLKAQRPLIDQQAAHAELVGSEYAEISLRASLLRIAHFSEMIGRRLVDAERLLAQLQSEAGAAPPDATATDPWQSYPQWVMTRHADPNLRERARLLTLQIRNVNDKLTALNAELETILAKHSTGLDSRLIAMVSMVAQFGKSVYGIDRQALADKSALLARFVRQGVLAAESDVYREISTQLPTCIEQARKARTQLPLAAQFLPRLGGLRSAAQALAAADLPNNVGEPAYAATVSERTRANRRSRLRSELEQLTRHLSGVLLAEEFQNFQNLALVRTRVQELRSSLAAIDAEAADWPQLKANAMLLTSASEQATQFLACLDAVIEFQARLGTLAGFQRVFAEDGLPEVQDRALLAAAYDALAGVAAQQKFAPEMRAEQVKLRQLSTLLDQQQRKQPPDPAALAKVTEEWTALKSTVEQRIPQLDGALAEVDKSLSALAALPIWAAPATRTPAVAPHPKISVASSQLFDALRCESMLTRLDQDLRRYADRPELQDAVFDVAAAYFVNRSVDGAKDALANPVEEYLQARVAAAFYISSAKAMQPFAETYARDGNDRKPWLKAYFKGRELPKQVEDQIDQTNYTPPELPAELAELAKPYLDAFRATALPQLLRAQRQERLAQLLALSQQVRAHASRYEALVRVRGLGTLLAELEDNVRLLRFAADDIRTENLWNEAVEQAEGLDRDLLAGRLTDIAAPARQRLRDGIHVFRQKDYAAVRADEALVATLAAYRGELDELQRQFAPVVTAAEEALRADMPALQRDLAVVLLSSFQTQYWFERQLQLELLQKQILLGNLAGKARIKALFPMGGVDLSVEVMQTMNLAAYGWRSIVNLRSAAYAAAPTDATRNAFLHDCGILTVLKVLPEYYFDNYSGVLALRGFAAVKACDAVAELMLQQVRDGRKIQTGVIDYLLKPAPTEAVIGSARLLDLLGALQIGSTIFQLDADLAAFQQIRQSIVSGEAAAAEQGVRKIRTAPASLGQFWRRVARPLAAYLELGQPLIDAETFAALPPATQRQRLEQQQALLQQAQSTIDRLGSGINDEQRTELEVLGEASTYHQNWLAAIQAQSAAADSFQPGYRDVYEAVSSLLLSLQGSIFPAEPSYPPRLRYKHVLFHFQHFNFDADVQNAEQRWFTRADKDHSLIFAELLGQADGALGGAKSDPIGVTLAFSRFIDSKYRYLMAFNAPKSEYGRPTPRVVIADDTMPEHLARGLNSALSIDLPEQDNRLIRQLYFEALQDARSGGAAQP